MRDLGSELERREHLRHRQDLRGEVFLAGRAHDVTVLDLSRGGAFVESDAAMWPGALVRVRVHDVERYGVVLRERHVPFRLRELLPRGFALRWVGSAAAH